MVVALVPELRGPRTSKITLYLLAHFVAVTSWVIAMDTLRNVPCNADELLFRSGSTLVVVNMLVVAAVYLVAEDLPPAMRPGFSC